MSLSKFTCALGALAMLSACQTTMEDNPKETVGTVLGAIGGAVIGAQIGKGTGQSVGIAIGTLAGAWLGSSIGRDLDDLDKMKISQTTQDALERNPTGTSSSWDNPDSGNSGTVTPTNTTYQSSDSQPCREYTSTVTIDGQLETITGTACRRPDGTWRTID